MTHKPSLKKRIHKAVEHGGMPYIITMALGWVAWISVSTINVMIAQGKMEEKQDNITAAVGEMRSDIKLILPQVGVNPKVREYISKTAAEALK